MVVYIMLAIYFVNVFCLNFNIWIFICLFLNLQFHKLLSNRCGRQIHDIWYFFISHMNLVSVLISACSNIVLRVIAFLQYSFPNLDQRFVVVVEFGLEILISFFINECFSSLYFVCVFVCYILRFDFFLLEKWFLFWFF